MNPYAYKRQCLCALIALFILCNSGIRRADAQRRSGKNAHARTTAVRANAPTDAEDSRVTKLIDEGLNYADGGKWDEAISAYSQAVAINPRSAEAYINMGDAYMSEGKYKEGFAAYQQAVRVAPWNADARYSIGAAYNDMAQYGDAFKPFVEAIRLDPNFAEAHYGIGYAYQRLENYKDALVYLRQAVRLKPDYAEAYLSLGLTYLGLHDAKAAEEQLRILEGLDASLAKELKRELHPDSAANATPAVAQSQPQPTQGERGLRVAPQPREKTVAPQPREKPVAASKPPNTSSQTQTTGGDAVSQRAMESGGNAASLLAIELGFWESIRSSDDPEEFAAYLRKYPNGQFAELARIRMRALESKRGMIATDAARTQQVANIEPKPSQETPKLPQETPKPVQEQPKNFEEAAKPAQEEQPQPDGVPAIARKEPDDLASAATLVETLAWIKRNFSNKFSYEYTTAAVDPNGVATTADAKVDYEPLKFQGCRIEWRDLADTLSVSLTDLDPNSVKVEPRSRPNTTFSIEVWNLSINATGGKGAIREVKGDGSGSVNVYSGLDLQFSSRERAERLARALQSAIKLCGGKPE